MNTKLKAWIIASRPPTLITGLTTILVTYPFVETKQHLLLWLICLSITLILQTNANLINDLVDGSLGQDDPQLRLGPKRALANGLLTKKDLKLSIIILFAIAILLSIYPLSRGGLFILILGIASCTVVYLYSSERFSLSRNMLGEITAFIFFGPVGTCGTLYLFKNSLNFEHLKFSILPGLFAMSLMALNNYRDKKQDLENNKKTLFNQKTFPHPKILLTIFLNLPFFYGFYYMNQNIKYLLLVFGVFITFICFKKDIIDHSFNKNLKIMSLLNLITCLLWVAFYDK